MFSIEITSITEVTQRNYNTTGSWADGTDVAEMAHFGCLRHNKFKNIALIGFWELYAATVGWMDGWHGTGGS